MLRLNFTRETLHTARHWVLHSMGDVMSHTHLVLHEAVDPRNDLVDVRPVLGLRLQHPRDEVEEVLRVPTADGTIQPPSQ